MDSLGEFLLKTIVCHGDSLTEAADLERTDRWTALIAKQLPLHVINTGIGGDTSAGLLSRFYPDVVQRQPDLVLILNGTNDLWWNIEINVILANTFAMAAQAFYHGVTSVIGLPLPLCLERAQQYEMMPPFGGFEDCNQKIKELAHAMQDAADQSDIPVIDLFHPFVNNRQQGDAKYYLEDGLHPNQVGHEMIAGQVVNRLQAIFDVV